MYKALKQDYIIWRDFKKSCEFEYKGETVCIIQNNSFERNLARLEGFIEDVNEMIKEGEIE